MRSLKWVRYLRGGAMVFLLALTGASLAFAQAGQAGAPAGGGTLHGQVQDPSGGGVANATVTATSTAGRRVPATSDRDGAFDIRGLEPGKYILEVNAAGFATYEKDDVEITAGQTLQLNIPLAIQGQTEQVTVSGDAPAALDVNPENNASALVLTEAEMAALPDDPDELQADLEALAGPSTGPNGGQLYIDGFTAGQLPPKSAIREIRINSNPFSAEYDKVGYGRIEIFTKPGTDKWHGQVFANENNAIFNTTDPFAATKPAFQSIQINGNLGGPLSKNSSLFINMDYRNIQEPNVISADTGLNGTTPIAFSQVVPNPHSRLNISPRFDYQLSKNNTLSVRYQYYRNAQTDNGSGALVLESAGYNTLNTEQTVQISDTQIISPKIINEIHFQFLNDISNELAVSLAPGIAVPGSFIGGGSNQGNIVDHSNHYEFQNYTSIALAKHFIKFGGRLRYLTDANSSTSGFNGYFSFPTLAAYTSGAPNQFLFTTGVPAANISAEDTGLYVEDDWRVRPNMTFSYGLRFETQNHISNHFDWGPRLGLSYGLGNGKTPPKTVLRGGFGIFYDRFLSAQILQATRQSLTGPLQQQFIINSPSPALYGDCSASLSSAACQSDIAGSTTSSIPTFYQIAPNLHAPYTVQVAASVERQLTKIANLSVSYLHSSGYDQLDTNNVNSTLPGTCDPETTPSCLQDGADRPNGTAENIYQYEAAGNFTQNQMIVNVNIRAGAKLTLNGYYTLNYADADTNGVNNFPSNPYNLMADYGRAAFDIRDKVFFGGTIGLPYGIRLSPFMLINSGTPYNVTLAQDLIGSSQLNQRPAFGTCPAGMSLPAAACFNQTPGPGASLVPVNYLTGPIHFTFNLRVAKAWGFGNLKEANAAGPRRPGGGGPPRGGGAGGRPGGPLGGPGGFGGGGGLVPMKRYTVTLSANARNLFNVANLATPIGNINSPLFTQSDALVGGAFSTVGANRQIFVELQFAF